MIPSSTRMWLGSATLAGLLLASCLTASASSQTATATPIAPSSMKSMLVASSIEQTRTYTEAVRKQMQWVSSPVVAKVPAKTDSVTVATTQVTKPATEQVTKPVTAQVAKPATAQAPKSTTKQVQVAVAPKQQVSRSDSSSLVEKALSLTGVPYVFGGTSRSGFDCSGFTQYVFKQFGVSLPRTAAEQFNVGSSVKRAQLQPGDLVFFTTYASGASHVGIYIGGGSFVHASNSGVRTTSLSDSYYASRYLGARRVR